MGKLTTITLPEYGTLADCWAALNFLEVNSGTEYARYEVDGVHRRLAAGISSILSRGTTSREFKLCPVANNSWRFQWESFGGRFSSRHWKVSGLLNFDNVITTTQVVVAVESSACKGEWTDFTGQALDITLSSRLNWVIAQFAARSLIRCNTLPGWTTNPLTEEEQGAYHDLHTSPVAAWATPHGRVLLKDDTDGSAYLDASNEARADLIRFYLQNANPSWELLDEINPADLEPETGEEYPQRTGMGRR